jgi:hypothetical protein
MNVKASVAPQPAFGHPVIKRLVSTHAYATQVSPPCEGGAGFGVEELVLYKPYLHPDSLARRPPVEKGG